MGRLVIVLFLAIVTLLVASDATAQTTITWWQFWTDPAIKPTIEAIVEEFEQANPDINVELTDLTWANGHEKIVLAFASGTAPDVVELGSDWIAQFADNGHLVDLSGDLADYTSQFRGWSLTTYGDEVYGFPWLLGTRVLFANGDLLKRAGYPETYAPVQWDSLLVAAKAINRLGDDIYGWGSNTAEKHRLYKKFLPVFWSFGGQIFSDDGRYCVLASDYGVNALRLYKQLHDSCGYVADQRGIEDAFLDGRIGFIISGDWLLKRIELEHRDIKLVSTLIPGPLFPGRSFLGGEFLAVNSASENKEAALKFIRFVTRPENQIRFCKANRSANPSSVVAQEDEYFTSNVHLQTFIKQIPLTRHPPVDPDWVKMETIIEEAVEEVLFEGGEPGQTLLNAAREIEALKRATP